jgi:hypothetical protein
MYLCGGQRAKKFHVILGGFLLNIFSFQTFSLKTVCVFKGNVQSDRRKNVFKLRKRIYRIPLCCVGVELHGMRAMAPEWWKSKDIWQGGEAKGGTGTQSCEFTSISSPPLVLMATVAHPWQDFPSSLTKIFRHQSAKVMSESEG